MPDIATIVLIVFIVILLIAYPIMMYLRNKKENQRMQEQTNSLKRGDKVLTTSGVYGTIVDLHLQEDRQIITIETGTEKQKGYISVDAFAIYRIFNEEEKNKEVSAESANQQESVSEMKNESAEEVSDSKAEENVEQVEEKVQKQDKKRKKD